MMSITNEVNIVSKILRALAVGMGGGVLFFVVISLLAYLLPMTQNDPFIIGSAAVFLGLLAAINVLRSK